MKKLSFITTMLLSLVSTITYAQNNVSAGYEHNNFVDKNGLDLKLSTDFNKLRVGTEAFITDDKVESYGLYSGVVLPFTNSLEIVPRVGVKEYRHMDDDSTTFNLGADVNYLIDTKTYVGVGAKYEQSFDNSDLNGDSYVFSVTRKF